MPNVDDFPKESGRTRTRSRSGGDGERQDEPSVSRLAAADRTDRREDYGDGADRANRVRFRAISPLDDLAAQPTDLFDDPALSAAENRTATDWRRLSRETARASRLGAIFIFAAMVTFWPVLTAVGHWNAVGSLRGWNVIAAYPAWAVIFTIIGPVMIYTLGYIVSRQMLTMAAADALAISAARIAEPDKTAVFNVRSVGAAVRGQIDAVNAGIDDALIRLASVEAMIRQHVEAIEHAGTAMEGGAIGALDRVAKERATLMKLTEQLNSRADDFAVAIAEKAQASIDSFNQTNDLAEEAERRLEERLERLEQIADRALTSFDALCNALLSTEEQVVGSADAIDRHAAETVAATKKLDLAANEAAESAARNAVNIGQFARRARDEAVKAADAAIEAAKSSAERAAQSAIDVTAEESERVADAIVRAVGNVKSATDASVRAATEDANRAIEAANTLSDAATRAAEAARSASDKVRTAGDEAARSANDALSQTERSAERIEARNRELAEARSALEKENARLEGLIEEQRQRADRLADAIARQTERLSRLAEVQLREQEAAARIAEAEAAREALARRAAPTFAPPGLVSKSVRPEERSARGAMFGSAETGQRGEIQRERGRMKDAVSWKDILNATDEAEPLDLRAADAAGRATADGPQRQGSREDIRSHRRRSDDRGAGAKAPQPAGRPAEPARAEAAPHDAKLEMRDEGAPIDPVAMIHRLQNFTLNLDRRLYGEPSEKLLAQFDKGDRNLFANRLLKLDEPDVKRRMRIESGRDEAFAGAIHAFLHGFESLLEEATASDTADDDLEEYLSSPLGKVYLLIGATVGYFA